jgi:50S ribosomal protein L16 3-hydroxylase
MTYSIGFRAPGAQELGSRFLEFLQDELRLDGIYEDRGLKPARHPARIADEMVRKLCRMLRRIRWSGGDAVRFLGCYLTEPKSHVVFARPNRPVTERAFATRVMRGGVRLSAPTRMLFRGAELYINGESHRLAASGARQLARLADRRWLPSQAHLDRESLGLLYRWYRAGYLTIGHDDQ